MRRFLKVVMLIGVLYLVCVIPLFSQSNELIDSILAEREAKFGVSVYLVLAAANLVDRNIETKNAGEVAVKFLKDAGWGIKVKRTDSYITLGEYSLVLMEAFKMKGGIMYTLFPSPRYASRELYYHGFIDGNRDPYRKISGDEVVLMLRNVMDWKEEGK